MGVYDNVITMAQRLIREKGQAVTWRRLVDGAAPDPTKPWIPAASTSTEVSVDIVFLPIDRVNERFIQALRGTEVPIGAVMGLMGAVSFEPTTKDVVVRDGKVLPIRTIDTLSPNGDPILHTIEFTS